MTDPIGERIAAGAFKEAVSLCARTYSAPLGRLCMAMLGNQAEAEEAMQETLLVAHRAMAQFRGEGHVFAWLATIARRICARRLESRANRADRLELVHDASIGDTPLDQVERTRAARDVRRALAELKPSEREVVVLRYQAGLSFREVAEVCGIEEAAARKRASRALVHLRHLLSDEVDR